MFSLLSLWISLFALKALERASPAFCEIAFTSGVLGLFVVFSAVWFGADCGASWDWVPSSVGVWVVVVLEVLVFWFHVVGAVVWFSDGVVVGDGVAIGSEGGVFHVVMVHIQEVKSDFYFFILKFLLKGFWYFVFLFDRYSFRLL